MNHKKIYIFFTAFFLLNFSGCYIHRVEDSYDRVSGYNFEFVKSKDYLIFRKEKVKNAMLLFEEPGDFAVKPIGYMVFRKIHPEDLNATFYTFLRSETASLGGDLAVIKKKEMIGNKLFVDIYVLK